MEPEPVRGTTATDTETPSAGSVPADDDDSLGVNQYTGKPRRPSRLSKGVSDAVKRFKKTATHMKNESKGELIKEAGKFAGSSYIIKGALEDPIAQIAGHHSDEPTPAQKEEQARQRALRQEAERQTAQRARDGAVRMYQDNMAALNPMAHA